MLLDQKQKNDISIAFQIANCACMRAIVCVLRFDVDFTEVHSYMTRGEAILQSPEFSVSRKDGSIQELRDKVQVNTPCVCVRRDILICPHFL